MIEAYLKSYIYWVTQCGLKSKSLHYQIKKKIILNRIKPVNEITFLYQIKGKLKDIQAL